MIDPAKQTRQLEIVKTWHERARRERSSALSSQEMRDYEVHVAMRDYRVSMAKLSEMTGLSHAALYKAARRGAQFKSPPLPF